MLNINVSNIDDSDVDGERIDEKESWDDLESIILYLLDAKSGSGDIIKDRVVDGCVNRSKLGFSMYEVSNNAFVSKDKKPSNTILAGFGDRWYANSVDGLAAPVSDILAVDNEVALFVDGSVTWAAYERQQARFPELAPIGRATDYYSYHVRRINKGKDDYLKGPMAYSSKFGRELPLNYVKAGTLLANDYKNNAVVSHCSVIEDYHRSNAYKIEISMGSTVKLAVDPCNVFDLLSLRSGPIATDKKSPVIHWVSNHIRESGGEKRKVKQHLRGIEELEIAGCRIKIIPPTLHVNLI